MGIRMVCGMYLYSCKANDKSATLEMNKTIWTEPLIKNPVNKYENCLPIFQEWKFL